VLMARLHRKSADHPYKPTFARFPTISGPRSLLWRVWANANRPRCRY